MYFNICSEVSTVELWQ